jgi:hypothetical protein
MEFNKKNLAFAAALIVLIIAVGYNTANKKQNQDQNTAQNFDQQQAQSNTSSIASSANRATASAGQKSPSLAEQGVLPRGEPPVRPDGTVAGASTDSPFDPHKGLTFQQAMEIYRDGYRFQFVNCHGLPGHYVVTTKTRFMLDNRDGIQHDFKVASITFTIPAYDFLITGTKETGTHMITCDGGGAAELTVVE